MRATRTKRSRSTPAPAITEVSTPLRDDAPPARPSDMPRMTIPPPPLEASTTSVTPPAMPSQPPPYAFLETEELQAIDSAWDSAN